MPPHWTTRYLGYRYERDADGPTSFDCWSFSRKVQREQFGRDVPFAPSPSGFRAIARAIPQWASELGWREVETPEDGDCVIMSLLKHPSHIGTWVGPPIEAVLHCPQGGPVLHDRFHLKMTGWTVHGFLRFGA